MRDILKHKYIRKYFKYLENNPVIRQYNAPDLKHNSYLEEVRTELQDIKPKYYHAFCRGQEAFRIIPKKTQIRNDHNFEARLRRISRKQHCEFTKINGHKAQRFTLATHCHFPLSIDHAKWVNNQLQIGNGVKNADSSRIKARIIDHDSNYTKSTDGIKGLFKRNRIDLDQGELSPGSHKKRITGEVLAEKIEQLYGISYNHSYLLPNKHKNQRLHLDLYTPKELIGTPQGLGLEIDGSQHDEPIMFTNTETPTQARIQYQRQLMRDNKKDIQCNQQGIHLIRISEIKLRANGAVNETIPQRRAIFDQIFRQRVIPYIKKYQPKGRNITNQLIDYRIRYDQGISQLLTPKDIQLHRLNLQSRIKQIQIEDKAILNKNHYSIKTNQQLKIMNHTQQALKKTHNYHKRFQRSYRRAVKKGQTKRFWNRYSQKYRKLSDENKYIKYSHIMRDDSYTNHKRILAKGHLVKLNQKYNSMMPAKIKKDHRHTLNAQKIQRKSDANFIHNDQLRNRVLHNTKKIAKQTRKYATLRAKKKIATAKYATIRHIKNHYQLKPIKLTHINKFNQARHHLKQHHDTIVPHQKSRNQQKHHFQHGNQWSR